MNIHSFVGEENFQEKKGPANNEEETEWNTLLSVPQYLTEKYQQPQRMEREHVPKINF